MLGCIPLLIIAGVMFPRWYEREHNPLVGCWFLMRSPVVVTGAFPCGGHRSTAPYSGGCYMLYVCQHKRGVSQAVYQPPSCPPVVGVEGYACPRSWLTVQWVKNYERLQRLQGLYAKYLTFPCLLKCVSMLCLWNYTRNTDLKITKLIYAKYLTPS